MVSAAPNRQQRRAKLDTASLRGVQILSVGTWNGDPYTLEDLQNMASAYAELKGKIDPPLKLGHDSAQKLAQTDGFPAVGWATNVYMQGDALLADFDRVPRKLADIIEAGGYDKVSSEVYFDREISGKTYSRVLKAVALLGADAPAVKDIKSISDVADLYEDLLPAAEAHYADYGFDPDGDGDDDSSTDPKKNPDIADDAKQNDDEGDDDTAVEESELTSILAAHDAYCSRLESSIKGRPGARRLRMFLQTTRRDLAAMKSPFKKHTEESDMDIKKLAEALGLPETATEAEVLKAIADSKKEPEKKEQTGAYTEADFRALNDKVGALTSELAERTATTAVETAKRDGKLTPAMEEWAKTYALKDPEGFKAYIEKAPKLAVLSGVVGSNSTSDDEPKPVTEAERSVAAMMGVSPSQLEAAKTGRSAAQLIEEARKPRTTVAV